MSLKDKWPVYRSDELESLWTLGNSEVGTLTFESAAYVARYVTKKVNGALKSEHYGDKLPERSVARSNRPGIGYPWLEKYAQEVLVHDQVKANGKLMRPPRYYDKKLAELFPEKFERNIAKRKEKAVLLAHDNTPERLKVKEEIQLAKFKKLKRGYEQ